MYGEGISRTGELVKIATDLDIIQKRVRGTHIMAKKIGQGSENAKKFLADHPEILTKSTTRFGFILV